MVGASVLWLRRDLRLQDNPALLEAAARGPVLPLFVLDPVLLGPAGAVRTAFLLRCLRALDVSLGGRLVVRHGDPSVVVPAVAREAGADAVVAAADLGPYGQARDGRVGDRVPLVRVGSPYAVEPGAVAKADGTPYQVFTPYYRAWTTHGAAPPAPRPDPSTLAWVEGVASDPIPADPALDAALPRAGEDAALARLDVFLADAVADYGARRDRPDVDGTSRLSPYLRWGCVHPRTVLARLGRSEGESALRRQLAWRDFYADVLLQRPDSARANWNGAYDALPCDTDVAARGRFDAWAAGRTGYPIVDAGMRQLLGEGWVHNRVRMIAASFLVKDLHCPWTWGARWFLAHLVDGDLASNHHGWQWVAGSGTDAAPYFRVFNPVRQGATFDPDGVYIRRWVPELAGVAAADLHDPARLTALKATLAAPPGLAEYPDPVVDHAEERAEALRRYARVRAAGTRRP